MDLQKNTGKGQFKGWGVCIGDEIKDNGIQLERTKT